MPEYVYKCKICGETTYKTFPIEIEKPDKVKCVCGEFANRVFFPLPVHYKADGFTKRNNK